jgi:hypothetical protein
VTERRNLFQHLEFSGAYPITPDRRQLLANSRHALRLVCRQALAVDDLPSFWMSEDEQFFGIKPKRFS